MTPKQCIERVSVQSRFAVRYKASVSVPNVLLQWECATGAAVRPMCSRTLPYRHWTSGHQQCTCHRSVTPQTAAVCHRGTTPTRVAIHQRTGRQCSTVSVGSVYGTNYHHDDNSFPTNKRRETLVHTRKHQQYVSMSVSVSVCVCVHFEINRGNAQTDSAHTIDSTTG